MATENLQRTITLDIRGANEEARTMPAVISSEYPVDRGDYQEILSHARDAVDLSRAPLPLIESHNAQSVNIGLVQELRIDGDKLRGLVRLGKSTRAAELWADIKAGIVSGLSIGYRVSEWLDEGARVTATRWQPFEVSLVSIPADPTAGLNRSHEGYTMTTEHQTPRTVALTESERQRRLDIDDLFLALSSGPSAPHIGLDKLARVRASAILDGLTPDQARQSFRTALSSGEQESIIGVHHRDAGPVGNMEHGELSGALADALLIRAGYKIDKPHPAARDFTGFPLIEMVRTVMQQQDASVRSLNRVQLFDRARVFGVGTSALPYLLGDVINKAVKIGMDQAPVTFREWVRTSEATDYKTLRRIGLGRTGNLEHVPENASYNHVALADEQETFAISKYGKILSLTREAILNDDLGELASVPRAFTDAANAKLSDLVYTALETSTMADGYALCHANHDNVATAPGALSATVLNDLIALMRMQTNTSGDYINAVPRFLIVPPGMEGIARILLSATSMSLDAGGSTSQVIGANAAPSLYSDLRLVVEPRLTSTAYYLIAGNVPPVELATIGANGVSVESENGFTIDGISWKIRLEAAAAPIEYRGAAKNTTS